MISTFAATWLKLTRPLLLVTATGATIGFAIMVTVGTFLTAARPGGSRLSDPPMLLSSMHDATVPGDLISRMVMVLGAVTLTVCAAHVAGEYRLGALSIQLVRQPRRGIWLAGTGLALATLVVALAAVAATTVLATAYLAAARYGVDTEAWRQTHGWSEIASSTGLMTLALLGFAVLGTTLALVLRSAIAAIGIGLVYGLVEGLISAVFPSTSGILPGQLLSAVAFGGTDTVTTATAALRAAAVTAAAATTAFVVFLRRDVTE